MYHVLLALSADSQKEIILDGMRHWEDKTCIRFTQRSREYSYIYIASGTWCVIQCIIIIISIGKVTVPSQWLHLILIHESLLNSFNSD